VIDTRPGLADSGLRAPPHPAPRAGRHTAHYCCALRGTAGLRGAATCASAEECRSEERTLNHALNGHRGDRRSENAIRLSHIPYPLYFRGGGALRSTIRLRDALYVTRVLVSMAFHIRNGKRAANSKHTRHPRSVRAVYHTGLDFLGRARDDRVYPLDILFAQGVLGANGRGARDRGLWRLYSRGSAFWSVASAQRSA
jgi:hypothetical protein